MKWKAGTEIVLYSYSSFATASQPREDRPLANECNNDSFPRYQSTCANRGMGPTASSVCIISKEEDPGFLGNDILACVDSYSESLFTMYSIYLHIYIQKVFLLLVFPQHPSPPAVGQCSVSLPHVQCHMSALYGFKPKDKWSIQKLDIEKEMLCILYFITVPGVYKPNKTLYAAACFPVRDEQKDPGCCL